MPCNDGGGGDGDDDDDDDDGGDDDDNDDDDDDDDDEATMVPSISTPSLLVPSAWPLASHACSHACRVAKGRSDQWTPHLLGVGGGGVGGWMGVGEGVRGRGSEGGSEG